MKSKTRSVTAIGVFITMASLHAQTTHLGDYTVDGNLTVEDTLSVSGNAIDFGTTGATNSAVAWQYSETTNSATVTITATPAATAFVWRENAGNTNGQPPFKMQLDGTNALSLFLPDGSAAGIFLDPAGTSSFSNSVVVSGTNNLMPNQTLTGGDSVLTRGLADALYLGSSPSTLSVNNSSLVVTSEGNVGIGTSNPEYALDVNGYVRAEGIIGRSGGRLYFTEYGFVEWYSSSWDSCLAVWNSTSGEVGLFGVRSDAEDPSRYGAFVQYARGLTHARIEREGGQLGELRARSYGVGDFGSEVAMLHQDGSAVFSGSVGIGTTNPPAATLHVAGNARIDGALRISPQGDLSMGVYTNAP